MSIELDVNKLSIKKIRFLQRFIENQNLESMMQKDQG